MLELPVEHTRHESGVWYGPADSSFEHPEGVLKDLIEGNSEYSEADHGDFIKYENKIEDWIQNDSLNVCLPAFVHKFVGFALSPPVICLHC